MEWKTGNRRGESGRPYIYTEWYGILNRTAQNIYGAVGYINQLVELIDHLPNEIPKKWRDDLNKRLQMFEQSSYLYDLLADDLRRDYKSLLKIIEKAGE